ncbi:MAG: hypothetical protein AAGD96_07245, partial [Chloroflexota bacterium]
SEAIEPESVIDDAVTKLDSGQASDSTEPSSIVQNKPISERPKVDQKPASQTSAAAEPVVQKMPKAPVQRTSEVAQKQTAPVQKKAETASPSASVPASNAAESVGRPPLHDVWPVQKTAESTPSQSVLSTDADVVQREADLPAPAPNAEAIEVNSQVEQILEGIGASRPSHSSVQVIPPRGSRPKIRRSSDSKAIQAKKKNGAAGPVQKESILEFLGSEFESNQTSEVPVQKAPLDNQMTDAIQPAPQETRIEPQMIETEVGSLPADFWTLLGDTPPKADSKAAVPAQPIQKMAEDSAEEEEEAVQMKSINTSHAVQAPIIQRQEPTVAEPPAMPEATSVEGAETDVDGQEEANEEDQIDLDELAQQVYKSLKKKLEVEWERRKLR